MTTAPVAPGNTDDALDPEDLVPRPSGFFHSRKWLFTEMLVGACFSLYAAFVLSIDAVTLAGNPGAHLSCNLNSVISCSTVAMSWQAHLFGFPNAFLGIATEPVVITIAVIGLTGVRFPRGIMIAAQTVYLIGFVFAYWLFFEALFVIHALCPWCLVVQLSTTVVFVSLLHLNILDDNLLWPPRLQRVAMSVVRSGGLGMLLAAWLVATIAVVVFRYGGSLLR
jgi:uncharacterized membrane protein